MEASRVHLLLKQLEGRQLDYYSYARDTPKGKECMCTLHYCQSTVLTLQPCMLGEPFKIVNISLMNASSMIIGVVLGSQ